MEILNLRPAWRPQDEALFDVQIGPSLRLNNLALRQLHNGHYRIIAPKTAGTRSATFAPQLAIEITDAVLAKLGGHKAHDERTA